MYIYGCALYSNQIPNINIGSNELTVNCTQLRVSREEKSNMQELKITHQSGKKEENSQNKG